MSRHLHRSGERREASGNSPQRFAAIASKRSRLRTWVQNHPMVRAFVGMVAVMAVALGTVLGTSVAVQATVPGQPGTAQPSTVVFEENFENGAHTAPVGLQQYTGLNNQKYTADPGWLTACNGSIVNFNIPPTTLGNCASQNSAANLRQLAYALGVHGGSATPGTNNAVAAYTENNPGVNATEFQTVTNIPLANSNGRFLTFSVDTAAVNCPPVASAPLYQFAFLNQAGTATNVGGQLNACGSALSVNAPTSGTLPGQPIKVGTYTSNGSVLFSGTSLGIRMQNANGSGGGNDAAFDNIRILDVTPQLDKVFSPTTRVAGETSTLTLTVTNTLERAAKNGWSFTDALPAGLTVAGTATTTCTSPTLSAPVGGSSISITANLAAGIESCTITVPVTSPVAGEFTNGPDNITSVGLNPPADTTVTFVEQDPALTVVKSAQPAGFTDYVVGQTINYSFVVTNAGNVQLTNVVVNDDAAAFTGTGDLSAITCPAGAATLAVGATVTCSASYVVTQADVDAGSLTNAATATATPPPGNETPVSPPSEVTVPSNDPAPALTLVKSSDQATVTAAGQTVNYSFLVANTGNVTLTDVAIADTEFSGTGGPLSIVCPTGTESLAPGAQITCTASYVVTQADIDAGTLTNAATASGTPPGSDPIGTPPSEVDIDVVENPAITVDKTADPATAGAVGDTITYSFLVTNTGNVTLADVAVAEGTFTGSGDLSDIVCPDGAGSLAPGASVTCTASYVLTQADVDNGQISNTATATGTPPNGNPPTSPPDTVVVPIPEDAGISIVKTADEAALAAIAVGQTVDYSFLVTNTGNVTLDEIVINDDEFSGTGDLSAIDCPVTSLAAGATVTCIATYVVTQADVDSGQVTNTATAEGSTPDGDTETSTPSTENVPAEVPAPSLEIVKSATPTSVVAAGETITYSFVVTNNGNVTITDVAIDEGDFSGTGELSAITCAEGTASLAPGASVTCTATYVTTQADIDSGSITNTATATGTPPNGPGIESPPSDVDVDVPATPSLTVVKTADAAAQAGYVVDQEITYSFVVTNTGNVTLTDALINDVDFSGSGELSAITCPAGAESLAPGASVTCTATYTATQADVDAGVIDNTATATATPPTGDDVTSDPSDVSTPSVPATPALTVVKTANPETISKVGDTITYSFLVTNTGNVTIANVSITEGEFSGTGELSAITCPAGAASLAPGASVTCTASYVATQADVDAGTLTNSAVATGTPPGTDVPIDSPPGDSTVEIPAAPSMTILKSATPETASTVGDTITYSFLVTNTGNVTIANVSITDTEFSGTGELSAITCPEGTASLAPGAEITCTATYVLTQADVDSGELTNTATSTGTPPGTDVPIGTPPSEVVVELTPNPAITVVKTADEAAQADLAVGQTVTYSFLVTNTGNVTMTDIGINDVDFSGSGELSEIVCPEGAASLAPGAQITCTATYVVTQADVDAAPLTNTATATGTPPVGDPVDSPESSVELPSPPVPALDVVKTASVERASTVGQVITYSFVATNTGNVTLTDVSIVEGTFSGTGTLSAITCPAGAASLAPGAQVTCTATYTVTAADLAAGSISNTATGTATTPGGGKLVSDPSTAKVTTTDAMLPNTGLDVRLGLSGAALFALGGILLLTLNRRRSVLAPTE